MIDVQDRPRAGSPTPVAKQALDAALLTIGIDVGGTKAALVVTDRDDQVLLHEVVATDRGRLAAQLAELVTRTAAHFPDELGRTVGAVCVALPGHVDSSTGSVRVAVNLGGEELALGPLLEREVGLPTFVEHDARAAATWLDLAPGAHGLPTSLAYLSLGTGISAGIVLDGQVLSGVNGLAGEIGHVTGDPNDGLCACGLVGCLEHIAAGPAMARLAADAVRDGRTTTLGATPSATEVFRAAAAGDTLAGELATVIADRLARAIRGLVLTLGVTHIIIGGGIAAAGDDLLRPVLDAINRERAASPLVEAAFADAMVELLPPENEAGARGAAVIARRRVLAEREGG